MKIAVLLTCFNRKEKTLNCLSLLSQANLPAGYSIETYLVDDGSTDGTSKLILEHFPRVNIIQGTGSLFWNGGMRLAWQKALLSNPDFYLWINDDSFLYNDAIKRILVNYEQLLEQGKSVGCILGSMVDPVTKELTYGGRRKCSTFNQVKIGPIVKPIETSQKCDFINGNFILIPSATVRKIGILSEKFTHSMGDFDYGLRAKKAGLNCWIAPGVYGECETNPIEGSWRDKSLTLTERVNKIKSITQLPPLNEWAYFIQSHAGKFWLLLYIDTWIRTYFPRIWLYIKREL